MILCWEILFSDSTNLFDCFWIEGGSLNKVSCFTGEMRIFGIELVSLFSRAPEQCFCACHPVGHPLAVLGLIAVAWFSSDGFMFFG